MPLLEGGRRCRLHTSTLGFASKVGGKTASLLVNEGWRDGRLDDWHTKRPPQPPTPKHTFLLWLRKLHFTVSLPMCRPSLNASSVAAGGFFSFLHFAVCVYVCGGESYCFSPNYSCNVWPCDFKSTHISFILLHSAHDKTHSLSMLCFFFPGK